MHVLSSFPPSLPHFFIIHPPRNIRRPSQSINHSPLLLPGHDLLGLLGHQQRRGLLSSNRRRLLHGNSSSSSRGSLLKGDLDSGTLLGGGRGLRGRGGLGGRSLGTGGGTAASGSGEGATDDGGGGLLGGSDGHDLCVFVWMGGGVLEMLVVFLGREGGRVKGRERRKER